VSTVAPSDWIIRWSHLLASGCDVLDVACGGGRHLHWFAQRNHPVLGVDKDTSASAWVAGAQLVQADIEGKGWPLLHQGQPRQFGGVVVTNYLWRPLMPTLAHSLAPKGVLLYETFAAGNETVGRPARADFLLQPGELLQHFADLHVVAYECGVLENPRRFVQRIAAVRQSTDSAQIAAYSVSLK
jgi:SAM-dependent methyltransferase